MMLTKKTCGFWNSNAAKNPIISKVKKMLDLSGRLLYIIENLDRYSYLFWNKYESV